MYWTLDKFMVISWLWGESKMASKAHHKRILMDYGFSQRRSWSIIREFERITDFLKLRSYSHNLPSNHFLSQRSEIASGSGTLGSDLLLPFRWSFCPKSNNCTSPLFSPALYSIPLYVSLVNTEKRSTTEFVREWSAVFDIRPLANNWGLENSKLMWERRQVSLKPVGEDFALRKWGVIWQLRNRIDKQAQI